MLVQEPELSIESAAVSGDFKLKASTSGQHFSDSDTKSARLIIVCLIKATDQHGVESQAETETVKGAMNKVSI